MTVLNFIGLGIDPTYVDATSDYFRANRPTHSLQAALYTLVPFYIPAIVLFLFLTRVQRGENRTTEDGVTNP